MKLVRYGAPGREKPGIVGDDGKIRDLSRIVKDIDGAMLASGGLAKIKKANLKRMKPVAGKPRLGPCVGNVRNFIAIGLNYSDHAAEAGMPIPKEPIIFNKAPSCICGPNDDTIIPKESTKLDYEVELGIVIGKRARYLAKDKAKDAIAGYFLSNDVSERVFQIERSGGQWNKGKGCETFGPIGPWFVTKDEIKDPQNLDMWLDVNGERRQRGNTRTMIFGVRASRLVLLAVLRHGAGRHHHHRHAAGRRARHEADAGIPEAGDVVTLGIAGARRAAPEDRRGEINPGGERSAHVAHPGHARRACLLLFAGFFGDAQLIPPCARAAGATAQRHIASDGASSCPKHGDAPDNRLFRILCRARQSRCARRKCGGRMRQRKLRHRLVGGVAGHRENMLLPDVRKYGLASSGHYWCLVLGR